jgi:hypothetical protein
MTAIPETRFVRAGDVDIAYQVVGSGPIDLVANEVLVTSAVKDLVPSVERAALGQAAFGGGNPSWSASSTVRSSRCTKRSPSGWFGLPTNAHGPWGMSIW